MKPANSISPEAERAHVWGADPLSRFLDAAHANARHAFADDRERYDSLVEVDALYRLLLENLGDSPEQLSGALLMRAHGLFLGAVSLALSGLVAEAYVLLNRSLKASLQGVYVAADPTRQQLWVGRNNDGASRKLKQAEFKTEKMRRRLEQFDPATAAICEKLLRRTMDHSDHPNTYADPFGKPLSGQPRFDVAQEYFVEGGEVQKFCLRSAAQVGICCLSMFFYVFPDRYRDTDIPDRLTNLRQGH